MPNADLIELIQEQWARERPDLASGGFGVVGRLLLLGKLLERRVSRVLACPSRIIRPASRSRRLKEDGVPALACKLL